MYPSKLKYNRFQFILLFILITGSILAQDQISTSGLPGPLIGTADTNATILIKDIFLGDTTIQVFNIKRIGGPEQVGKFESGASSVKIDSGVLLTTGSCSTANGPNTEEGATGAGGGGNDPDLVSLALGAAIFDAGGIEFDFISSTNHIQFNYVFGSEEYEEYTCSNFNDQFGFFLKGPSINKNIAIIPSTNYPVKINQVNQGSVGVNGNIGNCTTPIGSLVFTGFYTPNPVGSLDVQYDGFTVIIAAENQVIPGGLYHLKLIVGDATDNLNDSGVFLEAKSFVSEPSYKTQIYAGDVESNTLYETCQEGSIHFKRTNDLDYDQDFTVFLNVDPASTATSGVDYEAFPASIKIPAGEDEYILPIHILQDYIAESIESIKLEHHSYFSAHTLSEIFIDDSFAFVDSSFINLTKGSIYLGIIINNDTTLITKYQNQLGCDSTYLTFIHVITTSTDHILNSSEIIASPNPVINQLTINSPDRIGIKEWYIIDLLGFKVVSSHKGTNLPLSIDVATLPTGFYQWVGQSEKGIIGAGFIKLAR